MRNLVLLIIEKEKGIHGHFHGCLFGRFIRKQAVGVTRQPVLVQERVSFFLFFSFIRVLLFIIDCVWLIVGLLIFLICILFVLIFVWMLALYLFAFHFLVLFLYLNRSLLFESGFLSSFSYFIFFHRSSFSFCGIFF